MPPLQLRPQKLKIKPRKRNTNYRQQTNTKTKSPPSNGRSRKRENAMETKENESLEKPLNQAKRQKPRQKTNKEPPSLSETIGRWWRFLTKLKGEAWMQQIKMVKQEEIGDWKLGIYSMWSSKSKLGKIMMIHWNLGCQDLQTHPHMIKQKEVIRFDQQKKKTSFSASKFWFKQKPTDVLSGRLTNVYPKMTQSCR